MTAVFHGGPQPIEMTWKSALTERHIPTKAELQTYMREHRNWERWGDKSEAGMVNLITAEKRVASARPGSSRPGERNPRLAARDSMIGMAMAMSPATIGFGSDR